MAMQIQSPFRGMKATGLAALGMPSAYATSYPHYAATLQQISNNEASILQGKQLSAIAIENIQQSNETLRYNVEMDYNLDLAKMQNSLNQQKLKFLQDYTRDKMIAEEKRATQSALQSSNDIQYANYIAQMENNFMRGEFQQAMNLNRLQSQIQQRIYQQEVLDATRAATQIAQSNMEGVGQISQAGVFAEKTAPSVDIAGAQALGDIFANPLLFIAIIAVAAVILLK